MTIKKLNPDQILTLTDYPVHNGQILKLYHRMFWKGSPALVPPTPVISIEKGQLRLDATGKKAKDYNVLLESFLKSHPKVKYCLLDGSHKTTAAALCKKKISAMIFTSDKDIREARKMVELGELFSLSAAKTNKFKDAIDIVRNHFFNNPHFETVQEKTYRMVKDKVVPEYMIHIYKDKWEIVADLNRVRSGGVSIDGVLKYL